MKKILLLSTILALTISILPAFALAADLNYSADTTIDLSSPDINLTILAGSVATTLVVNDGNVVVTLPTSSTFTITSADRDLTTTGITGTGSVGKTCASGLATVIITSTSQIEAVTITPTGSQCVSSGGGGSQVIGSIGTTAPSSSSGGAHPSGTLVLDGSTVYLIVNGTKVGFRDQQEYLSFGYQFSQLVLATAADKALPSPSINKAMEGTLVLDASDGKTVYMIGLNSTKRGFTSESVFKSLGYSFANLPKINLNDYPTGDPIGNATLPHPDGALVLDGQTIWWIRNNQKTGFESMVVFATYGFNLSRVVPANSADKALPEGALVKLRDGTLVYDNGTYSIISNGKKLMFVSSTDLTNRGYKTSSAVNTSLVNYESDGTVQ